MIWIQASALAALVGKHKYVPQHEALLELWARHDPGCALLMREAGLRTAGQRRRRAARAAERAAPAEVAPLREALSAGHTVEERNAAEAALSAAVRRGPGSPRTHKDAMEALRSEAFTRRGVRDETTIVDNHAFSTATGVQERNNKMYTLALAEDYGIRGRVDGLTDTHVIEAKRRMRRFFDSPPLYERVQVHAYMAMTDRQKAQLVQHFDGEQRHDEIGFDSDLWDDTLAGLGAVMGWLRGALAMDPAGKRALLGRLPELPPLRADPSATPAGQVR